MGRRLVGEGSKIVKNFVQKSNGGEKGGEGLLGPTSPLNKKCGADEREGRRKTLAPLAKWKETEEEERCAERDGEVKRNMMIIEKTEEEGGDEEEKFVVRMREKKAGRMDTRELIGSPSRERRFEQRISQILESLQLEAESLIRLQENRMGESEEGRWEESALWANRKLSKK